MSKKFDTARTVMKIRLGRTGREAFQLGKILLGMFLGFALLFGIQVGLCKKEHPKMSWKECIDPLRKGK